MYMDKGKDRRTQWWKSPRVLACVSLLLLFGVIVVLLNSESSSSSLQYSKSVLDKISASWGTSGSVYDVALMTPEERVMSPVFEVLRDTTRSVHGEAIRPECTPVPASSLMKPGITKTSATNQHQYLSTYVFPDLSHGIFVEAGAADISGANTFIYEQKRCWTGLCVEPLPAFAERLEHDRPHCHLVRGALGSKNQEREFWDVRGRPWRSGFADGISEDKKKTIQDNKWQVEVVKVQTYLLHELLAGYGMHQVDLLSLDCEGCELEVLTSFRFDLIAVDVLLVELDGGFKDAIVSFLENKAGFEYVACAGDADGVFLRKLSRRYQRIRSSLPALQDTCQA